MFLRVSREILLAFFSAFGVLVGGSVIGSFAAFFTQTSPFAMMRELVKVYRIWAIVTAIGGTFPMIRVIESSLFNGQLMALVRQAVIIISALFGAYAGYWLVITLTGGE
ncbi:MAG: YtrH family sporulation protein [Candidatus Wallacebacter cryptica]|jgi:hypothetical protein|nr:hypothetical protein [Bacillota bacterium]